MEKVSQCFCPGQQETDGSVADIFARTYNGRFRLFFVQYSRSICEGDLPSHFGAALGRAKLPDAPAGAPDAADAPVSFFLPFPLLDGFASPASSASSGSSPRRPLDPWSPPRRLVATLPPAFPDRDDTTAPPGPVLPRRFPIDAIVFKLCVLLAAERRATASFDLRRMCDE